MVPVVLRVGAVYARGVKMVEAARWLLRHRLLAVWRRPTWEHLLALPDFHAAALAAIEGEHVSGVYNLGDDQPVTLQEFLDRVAAHWGFPKPWRLPRWCFPLAGGGCEAFAAQPPPARGKHQRGGDRKSTRLNSSHSQISYAVFCLKKKKKDSPSTTRRSIVCRSHASMSI